MGTDCTPLLADFFLSSFEVKFLRFMKKSNRKLAKAFNVTSHYIDDHINNPRFKQFLNDIYPEEVVVSDYRKEEIMCSMTLINGYSICGLHHPMVLLT